MVLEVSVLGAARPVQPQNATKPSNPNGMDRTRPRNDPRTILTARRLLSARSNVTSVCIESALTLRKAIAPSPPRQIVQNK